MYSYITQIKIERKMGLPVYVQVANAFVQLIKNGQITSGSKLPSVRELSALLNIHRKTVVAAYDEIAIQGWVEMQPRKGIFVIKNLPLLIPKKLTGSTEKNNLPAKPGFEYKNSKIIPHTISNQIKEGKLVFNDGFPDIRLAPIDELLKNMKSLTKMPVNKKYLGYGNAQGSLSLRETLSKFLTDTRGLQITSENILITRGAQMGLFIAASIILNKGDEIITGMPGYEAANISFRQLGAKIHHVHVDADGIDTAAIRRLCMKRKIRMVYVISHHHNPTTVTLSPEKRMQLLRLAEAYKFAILEDDYDYDFHYASKPLMPMASMDKNGHVVYIGTLTKTLAPAIRIGFMVAPSGFINDATFLRKSMDFQGDSLLENAIAEMYKDGSITRHIKKAVKIYRERRDYFCELLTKELGNHISFRIPDGGMSVWVKFNTIDPKDLSEKAYKEGLVIGTGHEYDNDKRKYNSVRLGFASLNFKELEKAVGILKAVIG